MLSSLEHRFFTGLPLAVLLIFKPSSRAGSVPIQILSKTNTSGSTFVPGKGEMAKVRFSGNISSIARTDGELFTAVGFIVFMKLTQSPVRLHTTVVYLCGVLPQARKRVY